MQALQLTAWKSPPEMREVPDPEPAAGQVVVQVAAAGACHSDLHLIHDFEPGMMPYQLPFTLGHENTGRVAAVGAGVEHLEVGEPVAIYGPWGCGRCWRCHQGAENYCERAAELGASAAEAIRDLSGGKGVDLALDCVGVDATMALAAQVTRPMGHATVVGIGGGSFGFGFFTVPYEVSLATTYWGTLPELSEVLDLARRGLVQAHIERFSLDEAPKAYEKLAAGEVEGRAVIVP